MTCIPHTNSPNRHGFTLLEVLLSLGIFALGFVFIASIFPVAALLQKEASDTVSNARVTRNATAIMKSLDDIDLNPAGGLASGSSYRSNGQVYPFLTSWLDNNLPTNMRSFPSFLLDYENTTHYWVPLFRDKNDDGNSFVTSRSDFTVYLFVLKRQIQSRYPYPPLFATSPEYANSPVVLSNELVPKVYKTAVSAYDQKRMKFTIPDFNGTGDTPEQIDIGDKILDNNGTVHEVLSYNLSDNMITVTGIINESPDLLLYIWFASPGVNDDGNPATHGSPTIDLITVTY